LSVVSLNSVLQTTQSQWFTPHLSHLHIYRLEGCGLGWAGLDWACGQLGYTGLSQTNCTSELLLHIVLMGSRISRGKANLVNTLQNVLLYMLTSHGQSQQEGGTLCVLGDSGMLWQECGCTYFYRGERNLASSLLLPDLRQLHSHFLLFLFFWALMDTCKVELVIGLLLLEHQLYDSRDFFCLTH
jgi:hypothetical protein